MVKAELDAAWQESLPGTPNHHEEGGWIYQMTTGEVLTFVRATPGAPGDTYMSLANPPSVPGFTLIATYHTHPVLSSDFGFPEASRDDLLHSGYTNVPWLIRSENGIESVGPERLGAEPYGVWLHGYENNRVDTTWCPANRGGG